MIQFFKNWCEGILVAVILSVLIEAILPEGNHKKYVKVVIGIYIIFTILNPFLEKLNTKIDLKADFNFTSIETASIDSQNIQELYANGIKETLKNKIEEEFGYQVNHIEIIYDEKYENIESITLEIAENGIAQVEKVQIGNAVENKESSEDYESLKKYISENYKLEKSQIIVH